MDDSPGVPPVDPGELRAAMSSLDPATRAAAITRARPGPGVEGVMISALQDGHDEVRRAAVRALARLGSPAGIRAIAAACSRDASPAVRAEAVSALGRLLRSSVGGNQG